VGIGITLVGVSLLTESGPGGTSWSGDLLALLGGILGAAYMLVGRVVRKRLDIDAYGALLCLACAAWILVFATLTEVPLRGFSQTDWMVLGAMAMGPQLFGHMGLNYAVRYMPAAIVTSALLLEPVGAALLGALVPSIAEIPTPLAILGGLVALIGVGLATRIAPEGTAPESSPRDLQADAAGSSPSHESVHAGD
jgi:drug/metabolite transporter (DMT)-like permease